MEQNLIRRCQGIIDLTWDNPQRSDNFRTLALAKLSGADGILRVNSDLANNKADQLIIGGEGTLSSLKVQVAYDPFYSTSVTKDETRSGKAAVVNAADAANTVTVSAVPSEYGEYRFTPTVVTEDKITYLTLLTNNGTTVVADPSTNALAAGSAGRHVFNAWLADTNNISKRMGELRDTPEAKGGIWARMHRGKFSKAGDSYDYSGIQVGYDVDHAKKNGKTFTGFAVDYLDGDTDAYRSSGSEKNTTFTLYHSYLGNNGSYYDFTAKYGHIYGDYQVLDLNDKRSDAGYGTNAWTFSGEYGQRKQMANGMYMEPQVELIYGHIKGYDYTTSYPLDVSVEASKRFISRLGVSLGKEFANKSSLYFTASWNHDFGNDIDYQVGSLSMTREMPRNWGSFILGGTAKLGTKTNAYLQLEKMTGGIGSDLMCNVGLRYNF